MCLEPTLIKNKKYVATKKNGGEIPQCDDNRKLYVPVGCGNCIECCKQKARGWQLRLLEDIRHDTYNKLNINTGEIERIKKGKPQFITLTFNTKSLINLSKEIKGLTGYNLDNAIAKLALRRFNERWRKKYKKAIRHWMVTELGHGETEHMHMHGILWTDESRDTIDEIWQYGYIWPRKTTTRKTYVNEKTINYIIKYITKRDERHNYHKPIILTSAGIGSNYLSRSDSRQNAYRDGNTKETYTTRTGHEIALPTYWRNKIYTEEEREKLWVQKLDKNERWVLGQRIDVSNGQEEYEKALTEGQKKNTRMGYKGKDINWELKDYENQRREMIYKKRFQEATSHETAYVPAGTSPAKKHLERSSEWE